MPVVTSFPPGLYVCRKRVDEFPDLMLDKAFFTRPTGWYIDRILHEIGHSIYFWLNGKKNRLTQPFYGYKTSAAINLLTFAETVIEGKAMLISHLVACQCKYDIGSTGIPGDDDISKIIHISSICKMLASHERISTPVEGIVIDENAISDILVEYYLEIKDKDLLTMWQDICNWYSQLDIVFMGEYNVCRDVQCMYKLREEYAL